MKKKIKGKHCFAVVFIAFIMINFVMYLGETAEILELGDLKGNNISEKMKNAISKVDGKIQDKVPYKEDFVSINGLFQKLIGKDIIEDVDPTYDIYKMKNGQLTFTYPKMDVSFAIESMTELKEYCDREDINLLYFQEPYKVNKYDNQLPDGYADHSNENADDLLAGLKKAGVDYIDYREVLQNDKQRNHDGLYFQNITDYGKLFFDGDHHWREETAFDAYVYLMKYCEEKYSYNISSEYIDIKNFEVKIYQQSFLGSQYSRVKGLYADCVDDFTVITPKTEAVYVHEVYNKNGKPRKNQTKKGTFEESVMYMNMVDDMTKAKRGRDNVYLGHNPSVDVITNNSIDSDSVLILQDSFGRPLSSFTALNFHKVYVMDLRYYKKSMMDYLEQHKDIKYVFICYPPTCFKESTYETQFTFDR